MPKINWTRLLVGGLVAAIIMFFTDGFFHEKVVAADWQAVFSNSLWFKVGAFHLVTSIAATLAGAAIYKDVGAPATAHG